MEATVANLLTVGAAVCLSAVLAWTAASDGSLQERPPREDYNSGAYLYRTFCATCHGDSGKGDGPVADLAVRRPSDLTALARTHGGTYPRNEVMAVLENNPPVAGHEPPAMPNWGNVLKTTAGDDARIVRRRLDALVDHVATLQQK
jgi:mono/diheme cytochrome c family protein